MNANDILKYGHRTMLGTLDGLDEAHWRTPGVCGLWSVREIVAHLASYEQWLVEIFDSVLTGQSIPTLERLAQGYDAFNAYEVAQRKDHSVREVLAEFNDKHARTLELIAHIPPEKCRENGILPWYGAEYDLDDFLVYTFYGHKREHAAQVAVFRDSLK